LRGLEAVQQFKPVLKPKRTNRTGSFSSVLVQVQFTKGPLGSVLGSSKMVEEPN